MKLLRNIILLIFTISMNSFADEFKDEKKLRGDSHAPIDVMCDHYHKKNEVMLSYRFMLMNMDGYSKGSSDANYTDARTKPNGSNYMVVPLEMTMIMHMLGGMYAISDDITLMLMGSYYDNEMEMKKHSNGVKKKMKSSGWGDLKFNLIKKLFAENDTKIHFNVGLSLPTGSISKKDTMFSGSRATLGYGMQLGSGTYDLLHGLTYNKMKDNYSYGLQISGVKRIGENSKEYTLGDIYQSNFWIAKPLNNRCTSISIGSEFKFQEKIDGSHKDISSIMSFAQDKESTGYKKIDLSIGINHIFDDLNNLRLAFELKKPLYNNVNAVQLEPDYLTIIGLQYSY